MAKTQSRTQAQTPEISGRKRPKRGAGGRPVMRDDERRAAQITFRTTVVLKGLAERQARAEGRSLANFLERLIWDECRGGLGRTAPYPAALPTAGAS
jgi:hypothetical protein